MWYALVFAECSPPVSDFCQYCLLWLTEQNHSLRRKTEVRLDSPTPPPPPPNPWKNKWKDQSHKIQMASHSLGMWTSRSRHMPSLAQSPLLQLSHFQCGRWESQSDTLGTEHGSYSDLDTGDSDSSPLSVELRLKPAVCGVPLIQKALPTNLLQAVSFSLSKAHSGHTNTLMCHFFQQKWEMMITFCSALSWGYYLCSQHFLLLSWFLFFLQVWSFPM